MSSKYDYVISSKKGEDIIEVKNSEEFLSWYLKEKPFCKNIKFINVDSNIKNLYLFLNYYSNVLNNIEKGVDKYNKELSNDDNNFIKEALDCFIYSNSGGKFLRASLCALGYHSMGMSDDDYLPLSIALEIFQTSILIHDDIIDIADKRRGKDTIPVRYKKLYKDINIDDYDIIKGHVSNSMALCLGDLGFYLCNQQIVKNYSNNPRLPLVLEYFNDIAIKTCKGEMIDVILPFTEKYYGTDNLEENILEIFKLKTAWYSVIGPYVLGCILGGIDKNKIHILEDALVGLGIAFQIKDDILGIYGDEKKIGKSISSDAEEFKQTLLYSFAKNTKYKDDLLKIYGKKNINNKDMDDIRRIFDESGAKDYSLKMIDKLFLNSINLITNIDFLDDEHKNILLGFAEFLKVRNK